MSQKNIELVRRYFLEGLSEDSEIPAWVARFWESDGDYYPVRAIPEARPCHGRDEIVAFMSDFRAAWEGYRLVVKDTRGIADDRVFVHGRIEAEGRASGAKLEGDIYCCCWLRHGRFIRVEDHLTLANALNALGLSADSFEAAGLEE